MEREVELEAGENSAWVTARASCPKCSGPSDKEVLESGEDRAPLLRARSCGGSGLGRGKDFSRPGYFHTVNSGGRYDTRQRAQEQKTRVDL